MVRLQSTRVDPRQQSLDFESQPAALEKNMSDQVQERLDKTLRLLGSTGTAADADVDAARMRAHVACSMAQRRTGIPVDRGTEYGLALLMLCVTQALRDGSLCVGEDEFVRQSEVFAEVVRRRVSYENTTTARDMPVWDFMTLVDWISLQAGEGVDAGRFCRRSLFVGCGDCRRRNVHLYAEVLCAGRGSGNAFGEIGRKHGCSGSGCG